MYPAFYVGYFYVDLIAGIIVEEGTSIENMPQSD